MQIVGRGVPTLLATCGRNPVHPHSETFHIPLDMEANASADGLVAQQFAGDVVAAGLVPASSGQAWMEFKQAVDGSSLLAEAHLQHEALRTLDGLGKNDVLRVGL